MNADQVLVNWEGPATASNGVTAWSYSVLYTYELCPYKYYLEKIEKRRVEDKPYFARGRRVHKAAEAYVKSKGETRPLTDEIKYNRQFLAEVANWEGGHVTIEQQWGFTRNWRPTDWMGKHVWFRQVCDWSVDYGDGAAEIIDWKSGKLWGHNDDEMEIFCVGFLQRHPHIEHVTARLVYFDSNNMTFREVSRAQLPELTAKWERRAQALFEEQQWLPRPNERCRQCDFSKSAGGPCRYG